MTPTIHLTNWASVAADDRRERADTLRLYSGYRRRYTIMGRPRRRERGHGTVALLAPDEEDMVAARQGYLTLPHYRDRYVRRITHGPDGPIDLAQSVISPGMLSAMDPDGPWQDTRLVTDDDTLCCACSRTVATAGRCHRVWAAELLRRAGWRVVLDGRVLPDPVACRGTSTVQS